MQTNSCKQRALFCSLFHHRLKLGRWLDVGMRDNRTRSRRSSSAVTGKIFLDFCSILCYIADFCEPVDLVKPISKLVFGLFKFHYGDRLNNT